MLTDGEGWQRLLLAARRVGVLAAEMPPQAQEWRRSQRTERLRTRELNEKVASCEEAAFCFRRTDLVTGAGGRVSLRAGRCWSLRIEGPISRLREVRIAGGRQLSLHDRHSDSSPPQPRGPLEARRVRTLSCANAIRSRPPAEQTAKECWSDSARGWKTNADACVALVEQWQIAVDKQKGVTRSTDDQAKRD